MSDLDDVDEDVGPGLVLGEDTLYLARRMPVGSWTVKDEAQPRISADNLFACFWP